MKPCSIELSTVYNLGPWTLKSVSLSSQNGRTFNDFNKFMRELPFLFMLEQGVEHGLEHTQDFSISCSTLSTISCSSQDVL